jgi:hypothetical protein
MDRSDYRVNWERVFILLGVIAFCSASWFLIGWGVLSLIRWLWG